MRKPVWGLKIRLGTRTFVLRSDDPKIRPFKLGFGVVVALICLMVMVLTNTFSLRDILTGRSVWERPVTVAHAGGIIKGYTYTNTIDAIRFNYEKGHRTFELDFSVTSDNVMVGKHDWDHVVQDGAVSGYVPTLEEFMSRPVYGQFEPTTFRDVCLLLEEYPDMWLITDTKNLDVENVQRDMGLIVETAGKLGLEHVLDRIIVQIYTPEMYEAAKEIYQFDNWIFTLYQYWDGNMSGFEEVLAECAEMGIEIMTIKSSHYHPEQVEMAEKYGIRLYLHSINDIEEAQNYLDEGVCGIYTDAIKPEELRRNE